MILNDTGWLEVHRGPCYTAQRREVDFSLNTLLADIEAFAKRERSMWHGQEFAFTVENHRLTMSRAVDSGD